MNDQRGLVYIDVSVCEYSPEQWGKRMQFFAATISEIKDTIGERAIGRYYNHEIIEDGGPRWQSDLVHMVQMLKDSADTRSSIQNAWMYREERRINNGTYRIIPSRVRSALDSMGFTLPNDHYSHIPVNSPDTATIAYTESADKGQRDKQTVCTFGRYIKKYFPQLSDSQIQELVQTYRGAQVPDTYTLEFTSDADKISAIFETRMCAYGNGNTSSCMYRKFTGWDPRPYHVYANSPDVSVAYAVRASDGAISARSVLNNLGKKYVRVYAVNNGDNTEHESLCKVFSGMLKDAGYKQGTLLGCRLSKLYMNSAIIAPYIDGDALAVEEGKWLRIVEDDAEFECSNLDGYANELDGRYRCADCEESYRSEEDRYSVEHGMVCEGCFGNYQEAIYNARGYTTTIHCDNTVAACDGVVYTSEYAIECLSERDGEYHPADCDHAESARNGECADCHETILKTELTILSDGETYCDDCKEDNELRIERKIYADEHQIEIAF